MVLTRPDIGVTLVVQTKSSRPQDVLSVFGLESCDPGVFEPTRRLPALCFSVTTSRILFAISMTSALSSFPMNVHLSHPDRDVEIKGPKRVKDLLRELNLVVEAHLVIRGDDLVTEDEV